VPKELMTPEMCMTAVRNNQYVHTVIRYMPVELITEEICMAAAQYETTDALKYMPDELVTEEICFAAVQNRGAAFQYVPEKFITIELCIAMVKSDIDNIYWVPEKFKTDAFVAAFIQIIEEQGIDCKNEYEVGKMMAFFPTQFMEEVGKQITASCGIGYGDVSYWLDKCTSQLEEEINWDGRGFLETDYNHAYAFTIALKLFPDNEEIKTLLDNADEYNPYKDDDE